MGKDSHDITKDIQNQAAGIGKGALRGKRMMKMARAGSKLALKAMKFFISKVILGSIKALAAFLGPYVALAILIIILLLVVVDSIIDFDIFQRGGEREAAEVLFDETVLDVMKMRNEDSAYKLATDLRSTQPGDPYPALSEAWLKQTADQMAISYAVPAILHYYKNLKNENYKPWHSEYKNKDVSTEEKEHSAREDFLDIIWKEYDYFFNDPSYQVTYTYGSAPPEYKEVKTHKSCQPPPSDSEDPDEPKQPAPVTVTESTQKVDLPSREIVTSINLLYNTGSLNYREHTTGWINQKVSTQGDCTVTTTEKFTLQVINDQVPISVEFSPTTLVSFLTHEAPEGKLSIKVRPVDLQYALSLGNEVDKNFPTVEIDFAEFIKCAKEKDISSCVGEFVLGGSAGVVGGGGIWYPQENQKLYERAANAYNIDWWILASIHGQETTFSSNPAASNPRLASRGPNGEIVGAVGHFQFMPLTWAGWGLKNDPNFTTTSKGNLIGDLNIIKRIDIIQKYGGFGVDANKDGEASPWDLEDAAFSAAKYLKASGYIKGNEAAIRKAIGAYNHSSAYVSEVWTRGVMFRDGPSGGITDIPIASGTFSYPTTGKITSGFGMRYIFEKWSMHYGHDYGGGGRTYNVPIVSVADGKVSKAMAHSTYGWVVFVKHNIDGKTYETVYAHLEGRPPVSVGQVVKKGQLLGYMGSTGRSTGKHLHFEIHVPSYKYPSNAQNPAKYIPVPPHK